MPYIDLAGSRTYHEVWRAEEGRGSGEPLVLLHGGYCSLEVMRSLGERLAADGFAVHAPERPGHGRTADVDGPYSYEAMAAHTLAYLDAVGLAKAHVVGFSDGAITALLLGMAQPERLSSLVAISANLDPSGFAPDDEVVTNTGLHALIDAENERLTPDGPKTVRAVAEKLSTMWEREPRIPASSLEAIPVPTLVMAADRDVVALEHTTLIARSIPGAQLGVVPGSTHLLVRERPGLIARIITEFLRPEAPADGGAATG